MKLKIISILCALIPVSAYASPTSSEFIPCNKMAVSILDHCLDAHEKDCWSKSKTGYDACRKEVMQRHVPNRERINAERKARDELAKKKKPQ